MHILGEIPEGEKRVEFIFSILRFDTGDGSLRRAVAGVFGLDLSDLLAHQDRFSEADGMSYGALLEKTDRGAKQFIRAVLNGSQVSPDRIFSRSITPGQVQVLNGLRTRILDIDRRLGESRKRSIRSLPGLTGSTSRQGHRALSPGAMTRCCRPGEIFTRSTLTRPRPGLHGAWASASAMPCSKNTPAKRENSRRMSDSTGWPAI